MPGQTTRQPSGQAGRTIAFGVLATCLALIAHASSGGAVPGAGQFLLAVLVSGTAGAWLAVRAPSVVGAVAGLSVVQGLSHTLFMGSAPMSHGGGTMSHGSGTAMTAAHAAAVLVTAWLLTRGERAATAVLARLRVALPGAARVCLPTASRRRVAVGAHRPGLGRVVVRHLMRRGPPGSVPTVA